MEDSNGMPSSKPGADHLDRFEELAEDQHLLARVARQDPVDQLFQSAELRVFDSHGRGERGSRACSPRQQGRPLGSACSRCSSSIRSGSSEDAAGVSAVELALETLASRLERPCQRLRGTTEHLLERDEDETDRTALAWVSRCVALPDVAEDIGLELELDIVRA